MNKDEKVKSYAIQKHKIHLIFSLKQCSDCQICRKNSQSIVSNANITEILHSVIPNFTETEITCLFYFAQEISYPNNPDHTRELFFNVLRKGLMFEVANEGLQKQVTKLDIKQKIQM